MDVASPANPIVLVKGDRLVTYFRPNTELHNWLDLSNADYYWPKQI